MSGQSIPSVARYTHILNDLLQKAKVKKPTGAIEAVLKTEELGSGVREIGSLLEGNGAKHYAAIETACRDIFYDLLASTSIEGSYSGEVWNLLDILSILSDLEYCEPGLVFWLVEELLDSQTIDGCKIVFDYLDSRREGLTAKHFKQKHLIILRACNELLRRLSRAEDTVFCGRVFIFLFQSFPLGDRSSVNLRGEYHIENETSYEVLPQKTVMAGDREMDIDAKALNGANLGRAKLKPVAESNDIQRMSPNPSSEGLKSDKIDTEKIRTPEIELDMDELYNMFWLLQDYFSQPTKLFDNATMQSFKSGLEATMRKFKTIHEEQQARGNTRLLAESTRGTKRKQDGPEDEVASSFNPKYLTSRDLFDLEVSDLAFRRHILVQALILTDFLLSLTPKAKMKLGHTSNKSVLYTYNLDEDDARWITNTRNDIANYLQQGPEGKFYYRMVDTVLSRDRNWVHWKAESCPLISRDPVSADEWSLAKKGAEKACANKRIRPTAMGALDLKFLAHDRATGSVDILKDPIRYSVPSIDSFKDPIVRDEFDIDMAMNDQDKQLSIDARASKLWRTLRVASKSKLNIFDKIDDGHDLKPLFDSGTEQENEALGDDLDTLEAKVGDSSHEANGNLEELPEEYAIK